MRWSGTADTPNPCVSPSDSSRRGVAHRSASEAEVLSDDHPDGGHRGDEDLLDELGGLERRQAARRSGRSGARRAACSAIRAARWSRVERCSGAAAGRSTSRGIGSNVATLDDGIERRAHARRPPRSMHGGPCAPRRRCRAQRPGAPRVRARSHRRRARSSRVGLQDDLRPERALDAARRCRRRRPSGEAPGRAQSRPGTRSSVPWRTAAVLCRVELARRQVHDRGRGRERPETAGRVRSRPPRARRHARPRAGRSPRGGARRSTRRSPPARPGRVPARGRRCPCRAVHRQRRAPALLVVALERERVHRHRARGHDHGLAGPVELVRAPAVDVDRRGRRGDLLDLALEAGREPREVFARRACAHPRRVPARRRGRRCPT